MLKAHFTYPESPSSSDRLQFEHQVVVPDAAVVDDAAVTAVVDRIVQRFREHDPKRLAKVIGGSKALAASLGIPW